MATMTNDYGPSRRQVEAAKARVREAARRFQLPFGVLGKDSSFRRALAHNSLVSPEVLVVQDVQLLIPPEYIFGLEPGDCMSLQTLFESVRDDFYKDVELALGLHRPPLLMVSASVRLADRPVEKLVDFMDLLESSCPVLRRKIQQGSMEMEGCLIDDRSRAVEFVGRMARYSCQSKLSWGAAVP